jgi:hypothetical protein
MRHGLSLLVLIAATPSWAAPPPPPPAHVWDAGKILAEPADQDPARRAALFADDVVAFENGREVAADKAGWLTWWSASLAHYNGRTLGYSESSGGHGDPNGELLVVDTFDTVDRTTLPPNVIADSRMATRSTFYQFGPDHLVHVVRMTEAQGYWMTPRP